MGARGVKKRVLVTGANGFVGSHILGGLAASNAFRVRGLVRRTSDLWRIRSLTVELVYGSLGTPGSPVSALGEALDGVDTVVHTAAKSSDWGGYEEFHRANVEGTAGLVGAAARQGVRRFVHISSVAVYGFHGTLNAAEESPLRPFPNPYCRTKALAEEIVLRHRDRLEVVVLRPSNGFGPLDTSFTAPLLRSMERGLPAFPRGGRSLTSPCYAANLSHAVQRAILTERGVGEVFNVTDGADLRWKDFLELVGRELGVRPPWLPLPPGPLFALSLVLEGLYRAFRSKRPPLITPYRIAQPARDYSFSVEKARKLLGYEPPFTTADGVRESARWYREWKESSARF
jgi:nucleoside-diphosphate-sugar epimerase